MKVLEHKATEMYSELQKLKARNRNKYTLVENDDKKCLLYTGLSWTMFMHIFTFLVQFVNVKGRKDCLPVKVQLFVTLIKLRINPPFDYLACEFDVGKTTVIDIFRRWINLIYFKLSFLIKWPDVDAVRSCLPPVLKSKFFIACTPLGSISFISKAWGGRATDIEIVRDSGFISSSFHLPVDQILADRGFLLHDDFATKHTPSFTKNKKQLSASDIETSRSISSVRIHVERIIGLMPINISMVSFGFVIFYKFFIKFFLSIVFYI